MSSLFHDKPTLQNKLTENKMPQLPLSLSFAATNQDSDAYCIACTISSFENFSIPWTVPFQLFNSSERKETYVVQ